jgi:hypothetical protein
MAGITGKIQVMIRVRKIRNTVTSNSSKKLRMARRIPLKEQKQYDFRFSLVSAPSIFLCNLSEIFTKTGDKAIRIRYRYIFK